MRPKSDEALLSFCAAFVAVLATFGYVLLAGVGLAICDENIPFVVTVILVTLMPLVAVGTYAFVYEVLRRQSWPG